MQLEKRKVKSYFKNLSEKLPDTRDNRGKRHNLAYVMTGVLIAILHGRKKISSIQRFLKNRQTDISKWTKYKPKKAVSDSQLRRIIRGVDWQTYNSVNQIYFGKEITEITEDEWVAIDGKELKGSIAVNAKDGKKAEWEYAREVLFLFRPTIIRPFSIWGLKHTKDMFQNYLKIGFRNLAKHQLYTLIHILGLALGLAAFLLINQYKRLFHKHYVRLKKAHFFKLKKNLSGQSVHNSTLA